MRVTMLMKMMFLAAALWCAGCGPDENDADRATSRATSAEADSSTADIPGPLSMPAEFERQDALLLGGTQLVELFPEVLVDVVAAVHERIRIVVLVASREDRLSAERLLLDRGLPRNCVVFMYIPVRTMWVRDFGPVSIRDGFGRLALVDFHYRERRGNRVDNTVPASIGRLLKLPVQAVPLLLEGGDFLSNGRGLCFSSTRVIERNAHYREYSPERVGELLSGAVGCGLWMPLPHLIGESTGHLDMFMTLVGPRTAVVGSCDPEIDAENAALLDRIADDIAQVPGEYGPLEIVRLPMPPHDDGFWRTYTNVVFANGILLVPAYPDLCPELDEQARQVFQQLLPDWEIVGIDVQELIRMNGALRCITMQIPHVENSQLKLP